MSFLQNGGLFAPTTRPYRLGDEVFLLLTPMDEREKLPAGRRVAWISPERARGSRQAGIGIEFSDEDVTINAKIDNYLADSSLTSERVTHTLWSPAVQCKYSAKKRAPRGP